MTVDWRNISATLGVALAWLVADAAPAQEPAKKGEAAEYSLDLPASEQLFRARSEPAVRAEIRTLAMKKGVKRVEFPADAQPAAKSFESTLPAQTLLVPPGRACFNTLYFEDVPTERSLQSYGVCEPLRSAFLLYGRTLALPYLLRQNPPCRVHCIDYPFEP